MDVSPPPFQVFPRTVCKIEEGKIERKKKGYKKQNRRKNKRLKNQGRWKKDNGRTKSLD